MYSKILKKKKKEIEELAPEAKPLHMGKKMAEHAMSSMKPEMEDEEEGEEYKKEMPIKKGSSSEAKIEIELILNSAKKKK